MPVNSTDGKLSEIPSNSPTSAQAQARAALVELQETATALGKDAAIPPPLVQAIRAITTILACLTDRPIPTPHPTPTEITASPSDTHTPVLTANEPDPSSPDSDVLTPEMVAFLDDIGFVKDDTGTLAESSRASVLPRTEPLPTSPEPVTDAAEEISVPVVQRRVISHYFPPGHSLHRRYCYWPIDEGYQLEAIDDNESDCLGFFDTSDEIRKAIVSHLYETGATRADVQVVFDELRRHSQA